MDKVDKPSLADPFSAYNKPPHRPMQDITERLNLAKILIRNTLASHQGTHETAVRYAVRQLDLPADVSVSLIQYAKQLNIK